MHISYISLILLVLVTPQGESRHACEAPYVCKATPVCTREQKEGKMRDRVLFTCASGKVCCPPPTPPLIQPSVLHIEETTQKESPWTKDSNEETQPQAPAPIPPVQPLTLNADLTTHRNYNLIPKTCGLVLQNKIVDGEDAEIGEFPWMALIGFEGIAYNGSRSRQFVCGGTLIADYYILTAAHCVQRKGSSLSHVRLGEFDLDRVVDCSGEACYRAAVDIQVEEIIMHPHYSNKTFRNDIALLRISSNATVNGSSTISPICLPWNTATLNITEGYQYEAAGWGLTGYREDALNHILKKVRLSGVGLESCNRQVCPSSHSENSYCPLQTTQICVQGARRKDVCKGDSGGPLMSTTHFTVIQLGITSIKTTEVCGQADVPSIFTRVESYLPWILDNMKK